MKALLLAFLAFTPAEATKSSYAVIFHLDSENDAAIKKTLRNIENILDDPRLASKVKIELIANSKGLSAASKFPK